MKNGFTLLETIIYIALFSLLIGTVFVAAYEIISNSTSLSARAEIQNEGNFLIRKINWVLIGTETINTPSTDTSKNLRTVKYDGTKIHICLHEDRVKIHEGNYGDCEDPTYTELTTDNVAVTNLKFEFVPESGLGPSGIKATVTLTEDNINFEFGLTKYLRR